MKWYWIVLIACWGPVIPCYILNYIGLKIEYYDLRKSLRKSKYPMEPDPVTVGDLLDSSFQFWIPIWNVIMVIFLFLTMWELPSWEKIKEKIYSIKI